MTGEAGKKETRESEREREGDSERGANSAAYNYFISAASRSYPLNRHAASHDSLGDANFQCLDTHTHTQGMCVCAAIIPCRLALSAAVRRRR